ncbi:MAG TPA: hypothetical protein VKR61_01475 [Bryobacteraceae bacterium]|nr:hypothetical protein [Bryobacteraceae bacterium]
MPLQNRVDPWGAIFRSPARGTLMGNRGALHNDSRELVRPFKLQRWISCLLEFKRRRRSVMAPGRYTELFFLDEAVAFAAGHRPCAECRRQRFNAFKEAWLRRGVPRRTEPLRAPEIDAELHHARLDNSGGKVTYQSALAALPNGCFVEIDGDAYLVWSNALVLWTAAGYASEIPRPGRLTVTVLTPRPIVECFRCGYVPETSRNDA